MTEIPAANTSNTLRLMLVAFLFMAFGTVWAGTASADVRGPAPKPPDLQYLNEEGDFWGRIRHGQVGLGGRLIQSPGEDWRLLRNGPLRNFTAFGLLVTVIVLAFFFMARGRIRIDRGWSGWTLERFTMPERCGHWILAVSFIILGLTGLNITYGKYVLLPLLGKEAFAALSIAGKYAHNYVAFAFVVSLVWVFVAWIRDNFPRSADIRWILQGGGLLSPGSHPPAHKFNAGQKVIFWLVILSGVSISLSGWALLFPFETQMFGKTFAIVNGLFGTDLPTNLDAVVEQQYAVTWHTIMAVFMICAILAHIYIGTIGMQGAFSAMGSGQVDLNWAREHHSLWVEKLESEGELDLRPDENHPAADAPKSGSKAQPAE